MKIRFGVGLGADIGPEQLAEVVDYLEGAAVDSLWFSELVYSQLVEPFVGMAFTLARTTRLKVGTSVAVLPGRVARRTRPVRRARRQARGGVRRVASAAANRVTGRQRHLRRGLLHRQRGRSAAETDSAT